MLVWAVSDRFSTAAITEQFKAEEASGVTVRPEPMVLDLGSGSGIDSVVPFRRIAPEAWIVAVDLSGELLALLADLVRRGAHPGRVTCVRMEAVSPRLSPGLFDLVIGASILRLLDEPDVGVARAGRALKPGGHGISSSPSPAALDPVVDDALRRIVQYIAVRSHLRRREIDSRSSMTNGCSPRATSRRPRLRRAYSEVRFVPLNDHASLCRDTVAVQLRLVTGREDLEMPGWAWDVVDSFDAAMNLHSKRELMLGRDRGDQGQGPGTARLLTGSPQR